MLPRNAPVWLNRLSDWLEPFEDLSGAGRMTQSRFGVRQDQLQRHVENNTWGHHACGTCKIGADDDPLAVLDSRFRVYGTRGLRVVDASVFPRIPGFFLVAPIYMIAEKAADVILADAGAV